MSLHLDFVVETSPCGCLPGYSGKEALRRFLLEAEEPCRDKEADQAVDDQANDIRYYLSEAFAEQHDAVQTFHSPGGDAEFGDLLHPGWLQEERPPRATDGGGNQDDQRDYRVKLAARLHKGGEQEGARGGREAGADQ